MSREEIIEFDGMEVTDEQFEKIECSECVTSVENCGWSGIDPSLIWYLVTLDNGEEVNIYG